jgi:hypothetical protein
LFRTILGALLIGGCERAPDPALAYAGIIPRPLPYTGIEVGFSSLRTRKPLVLQFARDGGVVAGGDRDWGDFSQRLGRHGARMTALGIDFYRSPRVPWADTPYTAPSASPLP